MSDIAGDMLAISLSAAVPLHAREIELAGGPAAGDIEAAREFGLVLGEKGDRLLFRGAKPGETAELFNRLARAVAVLSFCPGGVTVFGTKYEHGTAKPKPID